MSKFNRTTTQPARGAGPIRATEAALTHEGGPGYARDLKSEVFLLAVSNFVGEDTFYEKASERDARYAAAIRQVAIADPEWTGDFLSWLRSTGNMRSASLVGALEAASAMLAAGVVGSRRIVANVLQRADEPGEALAYWVSTYGRRIPKPIKRGIADAAARLYTERALLKYDTASKGFRFGDVVDLTHPRATVPGQGDLYRWALDRRHGRDTEAAPSLAVIRRNIQLRQVVADTPEVLLDADNLRNAGMTWEDALSLAGDRVNKARLWEALIPSMGYMALLRNLRNFDEAGVSDAVADTVRETLAHPAKVALSRQFPYRFYAAWENAPSLRWGYGLDQALNHSLANLPELSGRTLILVDTSASMTDAGLSARSKMTPAKAAAVFGVALAMRSGADLYGFATGVFRHGSRLASSVLPEIGRFLARTGEVGHGTLIAESIRRTFDGHDRVIVISDGQTMGADVTHSVPDHVALYGFNLGGYRPAPLAAGTSNRIELGGLNDQTFRLLPLIESGRAAKWPWE